MTDVCCCLDVAVGGIGGGGRRGACCCCCCCVLSASSLGSLVRARIGRIASLTSSAAEGPAMGPAPPVELRVVAGP